MSPTKPPHIILLPSTVPSTDLKIITLPHPRTLVPTRYLVHPTQGLQEITKLTAPTSTPHSWLLAPPSKLSSPPKWLGNGQILQDGSMYICTPMDPLFVLLPRLFPAGAANAVNRFLPVDDLLEEATKGEEGDWELVVKSDVTERRLAAVCESVDVGDEKAYKPSQEKLLKVLHGKCVRMAKGGLPATMEDEFVRKRLARPVAEILAEEAGEKKGTGNVKESDDNVGERGGVDDTEAITMGAEALLTPLGSQATRPRLTEASREISDLLRIRVASEFISSSYLSVSLEEVLSDRLQKSHDFTPLDGYLAELVKIRQEATAARLDDYTLKRSHENDEEIVDRKRKKKEVEAAEKKKRSVSRATKELQLVDKKGMPKLTTFFKKKAA
ncbi:ribonuclease H2, subunit B [Tuber brumale]|nr:ribonuclease H2, subunit B [Tuber brumale]